MQTRSYIALFLCLLVISCKQSGPHVLGVVNDFSLTNSDGNDFGSTELSGNVWLAYFMFTNCDGPCPMLNAQAARISERYKEFKNFRVVSITVDPERDSAEVLQAAGKKLAADFTRWHFLTGSREQIANLATESLQLAFPENAQNHALSYVLVDKNMQVRGSYLGLSDDDLNELYQTIDRLLE